MKDHIIIPRYFGELILALPQDKALEMFTAMGRYMNEEEWHIEDPTLNAVFKMLIELQPTQDARTTPKYKKFRAAVLKRDGYQCQFCGARKKIMHVHHIRPFAQYPENRTDIDNGITLCPECHREVHRK